MTRKGEIKVNTTDIFPIIKKWLYSEHDIFIRELISNACDAITKRQTISRVENLEAGEGQISIEINQDENTISFIDNGLGMTEEEVEKYIAQLAFSGAEEFVQKMKETEADSKESIIGKFGLGFYSAFMVADKVEVESLSYKPDSKPTKWTCHGSTDYEFSDSAKAEVGTTIKLFINEDGKEFLESWKTRQVLTNYCDFMPYPIQLVDLVANKKIEEENAKAEKEEDKKPIPNDVVNQAEPLWKKDPNSLTDQDYKDFYRKLFPMDQEPLFWLHLNVDHPFTLQGILYFPKLNMNKPINENSIRLYSKQVFVSDNVKNIVPEFLSLLKGAIDSSDIPLNVSRSALQGDPNVKKISNYIIKKVSEALKKLFKKDRERYNAVWEDIGLFVKYGCTSDTKFDEVMKERVLFKDNKGNVKTIAEYVESIPENFKEKLKEKILYYDLKDSDPQLVNQLDSLGLTAFGTDNYFDPHFIQHFEMGKLNDISYKFASVESELENLLETEESSEEDQKIQDFFQNILAPEIEKKEEKEGETPNPLDDNRLQVEVKKFKDSNSVAYFKVDEQMKRFAHMTKNMGQNNAFAMPVKKTLVINPNSSLIQKAFNFSQDENKKKIATKLALHVQDLAQISSEGLKNEEKEQFVMRSQDLIQDLTGLI